MLIWYLYRCRNEFTLDDAEIKIFCGLLDDRTQIWILDIQDWTPIPLARSDQLLGDQAEVGVAVERVLVGERGLGH